MLNERNKANKAAKNKAMRKAGMKRKFAGSFKPVDGDHPHGSYGEDRGQKRKPARKIGTRIITKGRTGTLTGVDNSSGPKRKLPDHTVYQDMGYLMAESLGLVSEATRKDTYGGTAPDRMSRTPFKRKESSESESPYKKRLARRTAEQTPAEREADVKDAYARRGQKKRANKNERDYVVGVAKDPTTKVTVKKGKGGNLMKGMSRKRR